jgi:plastocyanin
MRFHQLQNIVDGPPPTSSDLAGVVLRLDPDGSVPEDNPFAAIGIGDDGPVTSEDAAGTLAMVFAYGIRNTFGMAFHPETGDLWLTENGDDSMDEINILDPGANSGWLQIIGPRERYDEYLRIERESEDGLDHPDWPPDLLAETADEALERLYELPGSEWAEPVFTWVWPPAVTAIGFVTDGQLGEASRDTIFIGTVLTDTLIRYPLAEDGRCLALEGGPADNVDDNAFKGDLGESEPYVVGTGFGTVTDILQGPDGDLYVLSLTGGALYRVSAADDDAAAPDAGATPEATPESDAGATPGADDATPEPGSEGAEVGVSPDDGVTVATENEEGTLTLTVGTDEGGMNLFIPEVVEAPAGEELVLTFVNDSNIVPHNLSFGPPINVATDTVIPPGESQTITFTTPDPGEYTFVCTLHPGMDGILRVTE